MHRESSGGWINDFNLRAAQSAPTDDILKPNVLNR